MSIRIIITGGTIDKEYDPKTQGFRLRRSHIKDMLHEAEYRKKVTLQKLMLKDSLEMTQKDRKIILAACKKAKEKHLIITHGTDTMDKTAELLGKTNLQKTIVLTGALYPGALEDTDALFNLGSAIIASQTLPIGTYITMNGQIFSWNNVEKYTRGEHVYFREKKKRKK